MGRCLVLSNKTPKTLSYALAQKDPEERLSLKYSLECFTGYINAIYTPF